MLQSIDDPENIMLKFQSQKNPYGFHLYKMSPISKSTGTESRVVFAYGWEEGDIRSES